MWCHKTSFGGLERARVNVLRLDNKHSYYRIINHRRIGIGSNPSGPLFSKGVTAGCSKSPRNNLGEPSELDNVAENPLSATAKGNYERDGIRSDEKNEKRGDEVLKLTPLPKSFVFCPLCGRGHGVMKCEKCGGKGVVLTRPGGAGVAGVVGKARCSICNGLGKVPCLLCGGNQS